MIPLFLSSSQKYHANFFCIFLLDVDIQNQDTQKYIIFPHLKKMQTYPKYTDVRWKKPNDIFSFVL